MIKSLQYNVVYCILNRNLEIVPQQRSLNPNFGKLTLNSVCKSWLLNAFRKIVQNLASMCSTKYYHAAIGTVFL